MSKGKKTVIGTLAAFLVVVGAVALSQGWFELAGEASKLPQREKDALSAGLILDPKAIGRELASAPEDNAWPELKPVLEEIADDPGITKAKDSEALRAAWGKHPGLLEEAQKALEKPRLDLGRNWDSGWNLTFPEFIDEKHLAKGLMAGIDEASSKGDLAKAQAYSDSLGKLAALVNQEPTLIAMLVSIALDAIRARAVYDAVAAHSFDPSWRALADKYAKSQIDYDLSKSIRAEAAMTVATLRKADSWGRNWAQVLGTESSEGQKQFPVGPGARDASISAYLDVATTHYKNLVASRGDRVKELKAMEDLLAVTSKEARRAYQVANSVSPAFSGVVSALEKVEVQRQVLAGCSRLFEYRASHGQFPSALPGSNPMKLTYHKVGDGFVLYSFGPNKKDDGFRKDAGLGRGKLSNSDDFGACYTGGTK